jgi:hypothetical protein
VDKVNCIVGDLDHQPIPVCRIVAVHLPPALLCAFMVSRIADHDAADRRRVSPIRKGPAGGKAEGRAGSQTCWRGKVEAARRWPNATPSWSRRPGGCAGQADGLIGSLREIAAELQKLGFVNKRGVVFTASSVASMLAS